MTAPKAPSRMALLRDARKRLYTTLDEAMARGDGALYYQRMAGGEVKPIMLAAAGCGAATKAFIYSHLEWLKPGDAGDYTQYEVLSVDTSIVSPHIWGVA